MFLLFSMRTELHEFLQPEAGQQGGRAAGLQYAQKNFTS
jgi:hypothetical protein